MHFQTLYGVLRNSQTENFKMSSQKISKKHEQYEVFPTLLPIEDTQIMMIVWNTHYDC